MDKELNGIFEPDVRATALYFRLEQYYREALIEMDNRTAMRCWRDFKTWCKDNGYTQEEINRAKRSQGHTRR